MTLAETFDTHIKAISTAEEWAEYKAMIMNSAEDTARDHLFDENDCILEDGNDSRLQELKAKVEGKASEIEDAIEDQKEENLPVPDWLKGQIHAYLNVLQLIEEAINE